MRIDLFSYGDIERWVILALISMSLFFMWTSNWYDRSLKVILTVPRAYLLLYYSLVILDVYTLDPTLNQLTKSGIGSLYGILLLFGVEVYVRWVSKKYGSLNHAREIPPPEPSPEENPNADTNAPNGM